MSQDSLALGHYLGTKHWTMVVTRGRHWSTKSSYIEWVLDEHPWNGRRESKSRSQLGKLTINFPLSFNRILIFGIEEMKSFSKDLQSSHLANSYR